MVDHSKLLLPSDATATGALADAATLITSFSRFSGRRGVPALALMVGAGLTEGLSLALIAPLLAVLTGQGGHWLQAASTRVFVLLGLINTGQRLAALMLAFVAAFMLRSALIAGRDVLLSSLQIGFVDARRVQLVTRLANSPWEDIVTLRHARVTQALSIDIPMMAMGLNLIIASLVGAAMLTVQFALVCLLSPRLGSIAAILAVTATLASLPGLLEAKALGLARTRGALALLESTSQLLSGLKGALAHNLGGAFVVELTNLLSGVTAEQRRYDRRRGYVVMVSGTAAAAALAVFVVAASLWHLPTATMLATVAVLSRMVGPAQAILQNVRHIAQALPFCVGLSKLERELTGTSLPTNVQRSVVRPTGIITFQQVSFRYRDAASDVLAGVDLIIDPGDIIGVVGPSGSGKTTFIDLLCGLLTPVQGQITAMGTPICGDRLSQFRESIAYVTQDPWFFNDTIRRNLTWGRVGVDDDALWRALTITGLQEKVRQFEGSLDAIIAERGARLSGGERQRLALARAVSCLPTLLILDEATTALDVETERQVLGRLSNMEQRPTIVMVTHRIEALHFCTRVLSFTNGQVREVGLDEVGVISTSHQPCVGRA